jgi:hypothetical protein
LPENSIGCFCEIALFLILLFFRFALRFGHAESCHRSTLREILKFAARLSKRGALKRKARAFRTRAFSPLTVFGRTPLKKPTPLIQPLPL